MCLAVAVSRWLDLGTQASDYLVSNPGVTSNLSWLICEINVMLVPTALGYSKN